MLRVHCQWTRYREYGPLKTDAGKREVILVAPVAQLVRKRRLESEHKGADGFVFLNAGGHPYVTPGRTAAHTRR